MKKVICYMGVSAGDYGGGSRSLFQLIRKLDRDRFLPFFLFPAPGPILPELDSLGIGYSLWGKEHDPHGVFPYFRDVFAAMRMFRAHRVELLHINHGHYWRPAEVLAAWLLRIPVVTHYRMIVEKASPYHRLSSMVIANSRFTAARSDTAGVPVRVVYNVIDPQRFSGGRDLRPDLGLAEEAVVIVFLGQIKEVKGVAVFLELARRIRDAGVVFLLAGAIRDNPDEPGGPYSRERLDHEMAGLEHVRYLGYRADAENLYHTADIVVMPSQWDEPFGLINIEAGAAGKPVVATSVGGIPESVVHGENGFLTEKSDIDGLERYVRMLIEDPALRRKMGLRGREIVERKFRDSPPREMEQIYEDLIAREKG